ncbi:MerR family transcriptional regulator [Tetragenococcus muriaticus]|uniref:MerR family transcriptional regulator n=1 Tax=Tetragenococcus muriaticus TaxID=64642 RepID=UPI0004174259|nr:MerR family transcriptional regulator [Tetragenococcus muriaticus]GMA47588.1 HTH-type transcriptional regulator AdhR [Tetragenococcus muriaticus]
MKISEVSDKLNLTPSTLRYYEMMKLIPPIHRDRSGVRDYSEIDINWIEFIKCMREVGLPVESLKTYTQLFQEGDQTIQKRKEILEKERKNLVQKREELDKSINQLSNKIDSYDEHLLLYERELNDSQKELDLTKCKIY